MSTTPALSRRTVTAAAVWSAPVLVAATAAPLAAASTTRADLDFAFTSFQNGFADDFTGGFESIVTGSTTSEPTTQISAYIQLDPTDGATYSNFTTDLADGWALVQALGDGEPGTIILGWQSDPGLTPGGNESAGYVGFGYTLTAGPRTTSYTVTLISPTATTITRIVNAISV